MKIRTTLAVLFLFASGLGFSTAAANENLRPSYYYGSMPYEYSYYEESEEQRYPEYMPREFSRRQMPEPQQPVFAPVQPVAQPALGQRVEVPGELALPPDFIPYEQARASYSAQGGASLPQTQQLLSAPVAAPLEVMDADGFIPYEYARERYSN